jgi:HAD superfamily phosphatase (TIGR01668 family)
MKSPSSYLIPDLMCETVFEIPFDSFLEKGVKLVVFDIDNTLVPYDVAEPYEKLKEFLFSLKEKGVDLAFVSNNTPERVAVFNRDFGFFSTPDAHKPLRRALLPAVEHFGVLPSEVLLVGDQLLTDVLTARIWGAHAVAVSPIKKVESRFFRFKRQIEKPFVRKYHKLAAKKKGMEK